MQKRALKDLPLQEITLRKYEEPSTLNGRDLSKKFLLSIGLLNPGESRDVIVDIFELLLVVKKDKQFLQIENFLEKLKDRPGASAPNVRRQLRRLKELKLIEKLPEDLMILISTFLECYDIYELRHTYTILFKSLVPCESTAFGQAYRGERLRCCTQHQYPIDNYRVARLLLDSYTFVNKQILGPFENIVQRDLFRKYITHFGFKAVKNQELEIENKNRLQITYKKNCTWCGDDHGDEVPHIHTIRRDFNASSMPMMRGNFYFNNFYFNNQWNMSNIAVVSPPRNLEMILANHNS